MLYDPQKFLHSYCQFAALRAGTTLNPALQVNYAPLGEPNWNLFLTQANESKALDPYAVVRIYGGSHERNVPKPTVFVQLAVEGESNVSAWNLVNGLFRAFCLDNQERELRGIQIPGFDQVSNAADGTWILVNAVARTTPGQIARDTRGRVKLVSNFELGFYRSA